MPTLAKTNEIVAGYRLRKRLGAGGYGEVWSADAPGGLIKAVKFIYGYLDEDRAKRELKSLNRVRDVRHPFLLSLERIEVVEGQLVIVTELAEASLKERFIACRRQLGLPGIPRDELLVYIRDTGEALDYMREKHELQHLDVKPENLLLVGGRVKVADFGLVKDVGERTFTMMGGLTPLYAPPEVFEGHPSRHSDQYSLAIVFQELLTGKVPFSGKSAARLGLQHAKAPPDLSSLPEADRPAIERALSKDPNRRFASCLELVKALEHGPAALPEHLEPEPVRRAASKTMSAAPVVRSPQMRRLLESQPVSNGKPFDMLTPALHCRPTLFLGFGGTAGAVLDRLKQRMHRRFAGESVEAIRFLQTDVDQRALNHLVSLHGPGLEAQETMALPLRRPEYYRNRSNGYLKWISRRWLFNIPRSLTTDGLRPLARLAFVDNASKLFDRLREELRTIHDPNVLKRSEQAARAPFERSLRVVLVASLSGATGGGMVLDAAYAMRQIANEMGLDQCQVCGVLLHATGGDVNDRELGVVNAYATLKELLYYRQVRYPGDEDCGLNPMSGNRTAFDDVYLATSADSGDFHKLVEDVAEYLFLDTATEAGSFVDACRRAARRSLDETDDCYVQLFGVHREEFLNEWDIEQHVRKLAHAVIQWWRGIEAMPESEATKGDLLCQRKPRPLMSQARQVKLDQLAEQSYKPLGIDPQSIWDQLRSTISKALSTTSDELFRGLIKNARAEFNAEILPFYQRVNEDLTRFFGPLEVDGPSDSPLLNEILTPVREQAGGVAERVMLWLRKAFGLSVVHLSGAQRLGELVQERLRQFEDECIRSMRKFAAQAREQNAAILALVQPRERRRARPELTDLEPLLERVWSLRYSALENELAWRFARTVKDRLSKSLEMLLDLSLGLKGLGERTAYDEQSNKESFLSQFSDNPNLLKAISQAMIAQQNAEEADLFPALQLLLQYPEKATSNLFRITRNTLLESVRQIEQTPEATDNSLQQIRRCLDAAQPAIKDCGGRQRLMVMAPASSNRKAVAKAVAATAGMTPAVICAGLDFVVCYELEKLSLPRIAAKLVDGRQDFIDCAARVHTRKDVEWDDAFIR